MFNSFNITPMPKQLKYFLILIGAFSLLPCIFHSLAPFLGLSLAGFLSTFFWQPITFLFMQPNIFEISVSSIFQLLFYIFAIYLTGTEIILQKKLKSFYILFFTPGIIAALFLIGMMFLLKTSYIVFGLSIPTYCLLAAFLMLGSNTKILLFHALPIKASSIIATVFGIHLFMIASKGFTILAIAHLLAVFITYLYCLKSWKTHSPFVRFHNFEKLIMGRIEKTKFYDFATRKQTTRSEIIDNILDNANEKGFNKKDKKKLKNLFRKK
jgi:hypothetical protein